ncbi:MAG TPA: NYN domain-containing protein [Candidatus Methylomirabilis sp.]|nr:NYN domain-containing protein [Candidatus Methylomirabilis sp.]
MPERAVVFVDGNNWYHGLRDLGFTNLGWFNYAKVSAKLISSPREWVATRYYVGQVQQRGDLSLYAEQRRYMAWLTGRDARITVHYGRLEDRPTKDRAALKLRRYLAALPVKINPKLYRDLSAIAALSKVMVTVEKAVDVMLAVDMVSMAIRNEYDVAYLLAADGDYTPAAETVRGIGKKVIAAAPRAGAQLAAKVDTYMRLKKDWFKSCFGP